MGQDLILTHSLVLGERLYLFSRLRFLAAAAIFVGALFATYVVGVPGLDVAALGLAALFLAAYNVRIFWLVRPRAGTDVGEARQRRLVAVAHLSILLDYLVLTFALWQVGGTASPFRAFYLLHAILASVLLSRRAAFLLAGFGYLCLTGLVLGEWSGLVPRHPVLGVAADFREVLTILVVYGLLTALATVLTTGIVRLLRANEQGLRVASGRLEKLADQRRSFLHVVLHDLRGPVGTAVAMLDGLSDGLDGPLTEAQQGRVDRVAARLRGALDLLRDLRVLADLETENLSALMAPVDLRAAITAAVEEHLDAAEHRQQRLAAELSEVLPAVLGIERLLREAIGNYLNNAIKYTQPGGTITVRARSLGAHVRIEVEDNGPGIAAADQARLFQERAGVGRASGRRGGLGLGLSIVRRIAEVHRGRTGVDSEPGRGSTFFLELPVTAA